MTGPTFVRLIDGRLWHTAPGADLQITSCGRAIDWPDDDREPEVLDGIVPVGAWACSRCRTAIAEWLKAVDQAMAADPRGRRVEPLPEQPTPGVVGDLVGVSGPALQAAVAAELHG